MSQQRETPDLPLLAVRALTVSFSRPRGAAVVAAADVSFTLHTDQTLAIVGESGSGKSVTALSLLGLLPRPQARVEGGTAVLSPAAAGAAPVDLLSAPRDVMRRVRGREVAFIFQEPMTSLNPIMPVGEQVAEAVRVHERVSRSEARERAAAALERVGIPNARRRMGAYPHEFSGGMRQRVMIAMALSCEPRVLLADEPTTALDATTQAQILDLIGGAQRERGLGVVLITHDLGLVARRAHVVCVMYAGRVVEYGAAGQVFAEPLHPYTAALIACRPSGGSPRRRLPTIADVVGENPSLRNALGDRPRPWWPEGGLGRGAGPGEESLLAEVRNGRWVRVRAEPGVAGTTHRPPDVGPGASAAEHAIAG